MPLAEDLAKAYRDYYTHGQAPIPEPTVQGGPVIQPSASGPLVRELQRFGKALVRPFRDMGRSLVRAILLGGPAQADLDSDYLSVRFGGSRSFRARWRAALLAFRPSHRAELDFLQMYLSDRPGGRLLEVGCGDGWLLSLLAARGWQTEGLDFDPRAVEAARSRGLEVRLGPIGEQGYPDGGFDAVVMVHVLEHVPDPLELLQACHRVLRPGGSLVIITPNVDGFGHRWFQGDWRGLEPPRHLHVFTMRALRKIAADAGFGSVDCRATIRDVHNLLHASYRLRHEGRFIHGTPMAPSIALRMRVLQFIQWAVMAARLKRDAGDELVAVARRS